MSTDNTEALRKQLKEVEDRLALIEAALVEYKILVPRKAQ